MRILLLTHDLAYGGAARQLALLAAGLPRDRFTARVFTTRPDAPWSLALREAGVTVASGGRRRLFDVRDLFALRRALREFAPDVIHVFGQPALRSLALAGGRRGARVVVSAASLACRVTPLGRLDRLLLRGMADRVTARGPAEAEHCQRIGVPAEKLTVIPPGVPIASPPKLPHADWCRSLGLPPAARVVVGLGPLEPAKGFRDAIWAFDILQFLYDDLHVVLAGAGSHEARLREFTRLTRSTDRIHFPGPRSDLEELLGHAEMVWVPSREDRGAGAALETMAAGRPVVASRWPGLAEVVADGETGALVPPGDKAALARETRALLEDPERRRRLGDAGRQRVAERFSVEGMVRNHEALYAALGPAGGKG
ncbi:MAG TPA: glycosyltransferase [Gemmataceae bacterium]|nr:glycosyltransferase [Gemmataceae bacterium]